MVREALLKFQSPSIRLWWVRVVGEKSEKSTSQRFNNTAGVSQGGRQGQADLLGSDQGLSQNPKDTYDYTFPFDQPNPKVPFLCVQSKKIILF